ncbi:TrkH family potassium uptake protein [Phaeospirillum tilakii]|uniref:Trk system potassium uptake protein n=1 Tax=Phaeospirillum tilakii TaxID=741673 RepID=A0ABW5CF60_9PROT
MIDLRPVLFVNGLLLLVLAVAMLFPALADAMARDGDAASFLLAATITAFFGLALALGTAQPGRFALTARQSFLLTVVGWVSSAGFAALPFALAAPGLAFTDAVFEAVSGLTTTGATVMVGLDHAPRGLLLWRALLNWLGGAGIIVMAVAVLPALRIGGMQVFRMESSDKTERIGPRILQVAGSIALVYAAFTALAALAFWLAGMGRFDAICHALSAISTGGFSTSDQRLARWGAEVQWVAVAAMLVGGSSLILWTGAGRAARAGLFEDAQTRWYLWFVAVFSGALALWQWAVNDMAPDLALRHAAFSVTSIVSTTGYASTDWNAWGGFAHVVFFILLFIGGCTGSAAGGIKILRWDLLFALAGAQAGRLLHPHRMTVIRYNRDAVAPAVLGSVLAFVVLYFLVFALFALALTTVGVDFVTALSGSAAALANAGPGIGDLIGPMGSYRPLPDAAKWVLAAEMMIGRLELFIVAVLFSRSYWRP